MDMNSRSHSDAGFRNLSTRMGGAVPLLDEPSMVVRREGAAAVSNPVTAQDGVESSTPKL
jgi:hypothetical protein